MELRYLLKLEQVILTDPDAGVWRSLSKHSNIAQAFSCTLLLTIMPGRFVCHLCVLVYRNAAAESSAAAWEMCHNLIVLQTC